MKKHIIILALGLFVAGCGVNQPGNNPVLVKVNNYEITREEFEREFKDSRYASADTPEARKEFLDNLISRKLILQDAQARGLDKDKAFLRAIERFWEQSLLKIYLDQKTREIAAGAGVDDKMIEAVYKKLVQEGKTDKTYQEMYPQIKWQIAKAKEADLMNAWIAQLRARADIRVNDVYLNNKK